MDGGGAYGGGKAGAPFDPIAFVQRPQVILKAVCLLFAIIVFGCISSKGYLADKNGKEHCLYNDDTNACNYGVGIGVLAFLACIGFLAGEYLFEQMSSVKTRKHYVLLDLGFSGFWAFLYFVGFCYLTNAWNSSTTPNEGYGVNNVQAAIAFSFFSIFTWAGSAWFAFQRFKQGTEAAFAPSYEADPTGGAGYTSYPDATDAAYQEPPFAQQQQQQQQRGLKVNPVEMSEPRETRDVSGNACVVCYRDVEIYSIGLCEHPVCYECSTRMRVLCQQNECPICRQDLPKVVFTRVVKPFRHLRRSNLFDTRYNIYFDSPDIQEKFTMLLAHACSICEEKQVFSSFNGLKDHMRRQHELHFCDLCVENLRIFSLERRCYTRSNLTQHRRKGDPDDKSHKGHPLCEFCDQRYMDNDELFRHLRRDHLYCHFCDADGFHHYYNSYSDLREHFRQEHYLCEEGTCLEEMFTGVFRTDIDLKAHKASTHGKHLGKAAAKQARTLELEFTLAPRGDNRNSRRVTGGVGVSNSGSGGGVCNVPGPSASSRRPRDYNGREQQQLGSSGLGGRDYLPDSGDFGGSANLPFETEIASFVKQPDVRSNEEFPSLGNASPVIPNLGQSRGRGNLTIRGSLKPQTLAITDENFPALGPESGVAGATSTVGISKTVNLSVFSSNKTDSGSSQRPQSAAPNVSIHVNHKTDGTVTTRVTGPNIRIRPTQRSSMDCDFPALGRSNPSAGASSSSSNTGQWTKVTCVKQAPAPAPKAKKVSPSPFAEFPPPLPSSDDFPSLAKPARSKKQLSIAVLPQQSTWHHPPLNGDNNQKAAGDATKGKAKKKKVKQQSSGNNSSSNESTSSKSNSNQTAAKKKESERASKAEENLQSNGNSGSSSTSKRNDEDAMDVGKSGDSSKRKESERSKKERRKAPSSPTIEQITVNPSKPDKQSTTETTSGAAESNKNNSDAAPRKRSELKIDSLNSTNNNKYVMEEEFPALKGTKAAAAVAGGAGGGKTTGKLTTPPPGFSTATPPPPGFAVKLNSNERSTRHDSGLTFTNSSGESYSILPNNKNEPSKIYMYSPPPDFQTRNKSLVAKVMEVLGEQEPIQEFRYLSGLFRQGACSAEDYYKRSRSAMGLSAFESVFPEILVLLPDISKQQELFELHKREVGGKVRSLEACSACGQILKAGSDHKAHVSSHTMENHFPALGDSSTTQPSTTWVRKGV